MSIISVVNVPNTTAVPIKLYIVTYYWVTNHPTLSGPEEPPIYLVLILGGSQ